MNYETPNPDPWPNAVQIPASGIAVAWHVMGWHTEPDEDTHWSGYENRTGYLVCQMVGDDVHHLFEPDDIEPLDSDAYCGSCGQIGCGHS